MIATKLFATCDGACSFCYYMSENSEAIKSVMQEVKKVLSSYGWQETFWVL